MKTYGLLFYALIFAMALSLPLAAQQGRPAANEGDRGRPSIDTSSSGGASIGGRGISVGATSSGTITGSSRDTGAGTSSSAGFGASDRGAAPSGTFRNIPELKGTSFNSVNNYYLWQDFLWSLRTRYLLDSYYFLRFYRNTEPLITPHLLKLAVREPLGLSSQMILAVDELEEMINDLRVGKPVRKQDISAKAQAIREMAKKIRKDTSLAFIDQRLDKTLAKDSQFEDLGLEAVRELRQIVTDLNTQLKAMYSQTATSTVSVQNLTQPSFESLSKEIEKLTKVIENSARHL